MIDSDELSVEGGAKQTEEEALDEWLSLTQVLSPEFTGAPLLLVECCAEQTEEEALDEWLSLTQVLSPEFTGAPYLERDGSEFRVSCFDGGCLDRPTLWGKFSSLEDALDCLKHGPIWRRQATKDL